ncbi:MAG: A24 family peptidase [Archangium sp.]
MNALQYGLLSVTLIVALATDLKHRKIPDLLTYPAMLIALGLRAYFEGTGDADTGLITGLIGLAIGGGWFALFALFNRGMGWGDVKLAAVVGACLGLAKTPAAIVFISLAGAAQAVLSLVMSGSLDATLRRTFSKEKSNGERKQIPYAVAIAVGAAWAMWWQP